MRGTIKGILCCGAALLMAASPASGETQAAPQASRSNSVYDQLVTLFKEWRAFERPEMRDGAPDYSAAAMAKKHAGLKDFQARLAAIDVASLPVAQQIDHHLVRAEMNGLDFNVRVLKSWERDPAFYQSVWTDQSDTPEHEGPMHHAPVELWTYDFPLDRQAEAKLLREVRTIPPLLKQARSNLTGNARDLWTASIRTMRGQAEALRELRTKVRSPALRSAVDEALASTESFVTWLEAEAPSKTGPSGIGKDNYTWYLRNVHLVPLSWDEEVAILKRELGRAHAQLRLEEHRNRHLPPLSSAASAEEYRNRSLASVRKYVQFMRDKDILPVKNYMQPSLDRRIGSFVAPDAQNFFQLAMHREIMTLLTHFYHWWDLEMMREEPHPSPIRRGALLYNIWDSRSEGMATAMEEMMLHAGLYDDNPRVREVVWIMLAQRAARGLGSLYQQANMFTMKEASDFQVRWTPNAWMSPKPDLLAFEQQLYMRQPGYGSSYVSGKHQIEKLLGDYADLKGRDFRLSDYFSALNASGLIPVSLIRWEMTGRDDEIKALVDGQIAAPPPIK
jgi:uncharacterized protein (DUF885 family)